jgi:H+/Cl- antiporter ClcA
MLMLAMAALVVGSGGALGAWVLLKSIAIAINLFWFGRFSAAPAAITDNALGPWLVAIPVVGSLIVGLMARFGSDKIRGHGIPEAIEAILFGESRLSLKVALLKPLSSAISIGSGGPFGAEGPIIMTGGAIGSLFAQSFNLRSSARPWPRSCSRSRSCCSNGSRAVSCRWSWPCWCPSSGGRC